MSLRAREGTAEWVDVDVDVVCATASMRSGALLGEALRGAASEELENLAATLPEIFSTVEPGCLERVAGRLGDASLGAAAPEVLLLSDRRLHVIQPLRRRPDMALLAVGDASVSIGLVLSKAHAWVAALDEEP
jgi:hypothetical protein